MIVQVCLGCALLIVHCMIVQVCLRCALLIVHCMIVQICLGCALLILCAIDSALYDSAGMS